jgi:hypothetical protein
VLPGCVHPLPPATGRGDGETPLQPHRRAPDRELCALHPAAGACL